MEVLFELLRAGRLVLSLEDEDFELALDEVVVADRSALRGGPPDRMDAEVRVVGSPADLEAYLRAAAVTLG